MGLALYRTNLWWLVLLVGMGSELGRKAYSIIPNFSLVSANQGMPFEKWLFGYRDKLARIGYIARSRKVLLD